MSCEEYPIERYSHSFNTTTVNAAEQAQEQARLEAKANAEKLEAQAKADAEAKAQAVAQRIHFAKHYGEDFHGAIGDFFKLSLPEQEAFLTPMLTGCPSTAAFRIGNVLRDAAGLAA